MIDNKKFMRRIINPRFTNDIGVIREKEKINMR